MTAQYRELYFDRGVPDLPAVSLVEVKNYLLVTHNEDDSLIEDLTAAATDYFERYTARSVIVRDHKIVYRLSSLYSSYPFKGGAVQSIVSAKVSDSVGVNTDLDINDLILYSEVRVNNTGFVSNYRFPKGARDLTITYRAGMSETTKDVPASVKSTIMDIVAVRYENRGAEAEIPRSTMMGLRQHRSGWL